MERMLIEAHWGYYAFPLANGELAERGKHCCIDTANSGIIIRAKSAAGLIPLGIFMETMLGDGVKRVQVKLHREIQSTWLDNDSVAPIALADRGKLVYFKDDITVSNTGTGRSTAGMVLDVDPKKGVLVHFDYRAW